MTNRFDEVAPEIWEMFNEVAAEAQARSFQYMRIVVPSPGDPPEWRVGDFFVSNEEAIALPDLAVIGWSRLQDNKPAGEEYYVLALGNPKPPRPNSFTDQAKWEKWSNGRAKDPWVPGWKLPIKFTTGPLTGKVVIFSSNSEATRCAIGEMLYAFGHTRRRPLVKLTSIKRDGDRGFDPAFEIVKLTEDDEDIPGLVPFLTKDAGITTIAALPAGNSHGGAMDGDIPF